MPCKHFTKLSDEKKRDILNVALEEFVQYGYDLASTNRIVERARIAKGTLFKYFSTKEALFLSLCEQCSEELAITASIENPSLHQDFFDTLKEMALKEIVLSREKPELFALFQHMAKNPEHPVYKKALQKDYEKSREIVDYLLCSLMRNRIQSGATLERILLVVTWVLAGLKQKVLIPSQESVMLNDVEWKAQVEGEIDAIVELLKNGVFHES